MADSRFDNIRYYDSTSGTFKIPSQIKVYNGSSWVDYGTKYSYNTKKINVCNNNAFVCLTYYRNDVNVPKTILIGSNKYLNLKKSNGTNLAIDCYHGGFYIDMVVEVNETTPLYTCYTKNQGDIVNQSYNNYVAQVSGNTVRLMIKSNFSGKRISDGKYVTSTITKYTDYVWTKGAKVRILLSRSSNSGQLNVKIYNDAGTQLYSANFSENTQWVWTPNVHRIGSETTNTAGSQSTYGNTKMYSFSIKHPDQNKVFTVNFENAANGASKVTSTGTMDGYVEASGTSVYGQSYSEYIRQTV